MGIFDKVTPDQVEQAQYFERGVYVRPGLYLGEVIKVKEGTMRPPKNTGFYVVEFKVLESNNQDPQKGHPIGTTMTWMATADKDAFLGNVKHFVAAASGHGIVADVTKEDLMGSVSDANPLMGVVLQVEGTLIKTKEDKDFTRVKFTFVSDGQESAASA